MRCRHPASLTPEDREARRALPHSLAVVDIRELAQRDTERSGMTGCCVPIPGEYAGETLRSKRPRSDNRIRLASSASASPWDGRPQRWTGYA